MFRLAVLSIVLTVAGGQNAALLCRIACHPDAAAIPACEHHDAMASLRILAGDACAETTAGMAAIVREGVRSGAGSSDAQPAPVPAFRVPISSPPGAFTAWTFTVHHQRRAPRPLPTVLRI